jgi:hypothetical protein
MTEAKKKPVGRPRKYSAGRPTWTIRLEPNFRDEIMRIANETGQSLSAVCEKQIVASFRMQPELERLRSEAIHSSLLNQRTIQALQVSGIEKQQLERRVRELMDLNALLFGKLDELTLAFKNREVITPEIEALIQSALKKAMKQEAEERAARENNSAKKDD